MDFEEPVTDCRAVFVLHHGHVLEDGEEDVKLIGCYSSRAAADAAIQRLRHKPGFDITPDDFTIDEYVLDQDNWADGFVTV